MINRMFAIQDIKAAAFHAPFCASNEATAQRMCQDMVRREGHPYAMHPEDYVLYEVGTYDDLDARVEAVPPRSICQLGSLI